MMGVIMSRFTVPVFRTLAAQYKVAAEKRAETVSKELLPSVAHTLNLPTVGGDVNNLHASGTAVAVATPAYTKWLAQWQSVNKYIGAKRVDKDGNVIGDLMESAPEFETEDEETEAPTEMGQETVEAIGEMKMDSDGIERYHISDDYQPYMPAEFDSKLDGDAAKLSDLYTIQTAVAKRIGFDFEDVMAGVEAELKEFHVDDLDFELPDNLEDIVHQAIDTETARLRITHQSGECK